MDLFDRIKHFLSKSKPEKTFIARFRFKSIWNRLFPLVPLPVHLPYGGWWLAMNDTCSDAIFTESFEKAEMSFAQRFLKEGMTVLDIGAHHGFYTILASKKVGSSGRVIAFEPSPRERQRLLLHLKLNRCTNVKVEPFALAGQNGEAMLFVVDGRDTGCNSLRPPAVSEPTRTIPISTKTLDGYLENQGLNHVDFVKLDVEGAELEVLKGARHLLSRNSRPIIMVEVSDVRTEPWGYSAAAIFDFLSEQNYYWFSFAPEGELQPFIRREGYYNFVAVPDEKLADVKEFIKTAE